MHGSRIRDVACQSRRGTSFPWLSKNTVAQSCHSHRRRGVAGTLTALWHGAIFCPILNSPENAVYRQYCCLSREMLPTHTTEESNKVGNALKYRL